jgi:mono/diheme cytochrome c family protein
MRGFVLGVIFTILVILVGGYLFLKQGYMDFSADQQPSRVERHFAMAAVDASTERRAPDQKNPLQPTNENLVAGAVLYRNHCAGCHGTPSNPDSQFGRSFNPPVPQFFKEGADMPDSQNFYLIQHGVRWTGMPAWSKTLSENQTWQIVTFLSHTEKLPPAAAKELEPHESSAPSPATSTTR